MVYGFPELKIPTDEREIIFVDGISSCPNDGDGSEHEGGFAYGSYRLRSIESDCNRPVGKYWRRTIPSK